MLLVLGALMILSAVTLSVNRMLVSKTQTMLASEANLTSISVAQAMIDEIMTKAFDEKVADGTKVFNDSSQFTPTALFGPSGAEAASVPLPEPPDTASPYKSDKYYNDVSDYQYYRRYVFTPMGTFAVIDTIYYVSETNPDQMTIPQSFHKKIVVTVRHPNLNAPDVGYTPWSGPYYFQLSDVSVYRRYF